MSKVTAPLLSFGAAGQVAKTQVYASWKGVPYVRRYVIPANPQSTEQTKTRNSFAWLQNVYQLSPQDFRAAWDAFASGRPLTGRNAWTSKNNPILRPITDLTGMIGSPGAKGGLSAAVALTNTATTITATITTPAVLPSGWTIVKGVAIAIKNQNPQSATDYEIFSATDATDPYAPVITGLTTATEYAVAAWLVYQRSALATDLAYGPATVAMETTA